MATIERTYGADGRVEVEPLYHMLFTLEKGAHTFVITLENGDVLAEATDVFARFRRSDGQTVHIVGTLSGVTATVTLPETCYNAPGPFGLSIFVTNEAINAESGGDVDPMTVCVYACAGQVAPTTTDDVITEETTPSKTMEEMIADVKQDIAGAHQMAVWAVNIGNIEGKVDTFNATVSGIEDALAEQGIWAMRENMLNKDAWWVNSGSDNVVCGDAARWSKSGGAWMKSITSYKVYTTEPTAEETAGATYVYHREADAGAGITEAWYVYRDADDGITTQCVTLTGDNIVTEINGETFDKALQYTIVENTAWGNMETLYYPQGLSTRTYKQGDPFKSYGYIIDDMEVGKTYTVSCWARITSGSEAWLKFGWGGQYYNGMSYPEGRVGHSDVIKVTGSEWHRIAWTFDFEPTGPEYTETTESVTEDGVTYTKVTRSYNWAKRVIIGVHRKYTATLQLCGFRLSKGGLYGSDTVDTLKNEIDRQNAVIAALTARVEALERG